MRDFFGEGADAYFDDNAHMRAPSETANIPEWVLGYDLSAAVVAWMEEENRG